MGSHHGWAYRMQPEKGTVRVVNEPIIAGVCVVINSFQEQIRGLWKGDTVSFSAARARIELIQPFRRSVIVVSETCASVTTERPVSVRLWGIRYSIAFPLNESRVSIPWADRMA